MKSLDQRILRTEEWGRIREADLGPACLIVMPEDWPEEDCRAYDALPQRGEFEAWADLLEKNTGQRPGPRTRVIALRLRLDGQQRVVAGSPDHPGLSVQCAECLIGAQLSHKPTNTSGLKVTFEAGTRRSTNSAIRYQGSGSLQLACSQLVAM